MTAAQRRVFEAHPDRGGSHEQALAAVDAYKRLTDPLHDVRPDDRALLSLIVGSPGLRSCDLNERCSRPVHHALGRLSRWRLIHEQRGYAPDVTGRGNVSVRWFAGAAPKRLVAA